MPSSLRPILVARRWATSLGQIDDIGVNLTDYPVNGTIFDTLDAHGISWKNYWTTSSSLELFPKLFSNNQGTKSINISNFFTGAAAGTLPAYSFVEPDYGNQSEENPQNIAVGEEFSAKVINAVINGPDWDRTLLSLTYDEHGGYYDHVPPPSAIAPDNIGPILVPGENGFDGFNRYDTPHDWLFPRTSLIIHHGGSGTSHSVARSGIPSIVLPFAGDQPFWAERLRLLGVTPDYTSVRQVNAASLARMIDIAGSTEMRGRAASLGETMRSEDGLTSAIKTIDLLLHATAKRPQA